MEQKVVQVARGWEEERERGRSFFNGCRVSVLQGKKVLGDGLRNNVNVLNTLTYTLEDGEDSKFYVICI